MLQMTVSALLSDWFEPLSGSCRVSMPMSHFSFDSDDKLTSVVEKTRKYLFYRRSMVVVDGLRSRVALFEASLRDVLALQLVKLPLTRNIMASDS